MPNNALKVVQPGTDPLASDISQFALLFQAMLDAGPLQLAGPQATPAAPTAAAGTGSGNLNGAYTWQVVLVTGWKQGDNTYYVSGFSPSAASASTTLTNTPGALSGVATGTGPVIARAIYRTAAGGAAGTEKYAGIIWDNTTTTFTDNVADANLGTGMPSVSGTAIPSTVPTSNTTGTSLAANLTAKELTIKGVPSVIDVGSGTWIGFYKTDGTTRVGYVGPAGSNVNDMSISSDNGKVIISGDIDAGQYNQASSSVDANGNYTVVTYTRPGGNKYMVSTLSGTMDSNGNYPTLTNQFYKLDGVTLDHTDTWTLTWDTNSKLTNATVVRS